MTAPASISVISEESNFKFKFQSLILVMSAILNVDPKKEQMAALNADQAGLSREAAHIVLLSSSVQSTHSSEQK